MAGPDDFKEQMRKFRDSSGPSDGLAPHLVDMLMSLLPHMVPEDSYGPDLGPLDVWKPGMRSSELRLNLPEMGKYKITVEKIS